jgi:hypothetical protein
MRWPLIPQPSKLPASAVALLLFQVRQLTHKQVYLLLLADHYLVQLLYQVFGEAGFDFQLGQALVGEVGVGHGAIGHDGAMPPRMAPSTPDSSGLDAQQLLGLAQCLHGVVVLAGLVRGLAVGAQLGHLVGHVLGQGGLGGQLRVYRFHFIGAVVGPGAAAGRQQRQGCQALGEFAHGRLRSSE